MIKHLSKYFKYFFSVFISFLLFSNFCFSATLQLQKIGALDLGGKTYSEWWYTEINPVFSGVSTASSKVDIKIGDSLYSTNSDASGNWSYASQMEKGDYVIEISQGAEKLSFKLHLGQSMPTTIGSGTAPAGGTVPVTGFNQFVALSMGMGIILLATYFYFSTDSKKNAVFENRMIKEK